MRCSLSWMSIATRSSPCARTSVYIHLYSQREQLYAKDWNVGPQLIYCFRPPSAWSLCLTQPSPAINQPSGSGFTRRVRW
jgi:hypothetical protein